MGTTDRGQSSVRKVFSLPICGAYWQLAARRTLQLPPPSLCRRGSPTCRQPKSAAFLWSLAAMASAMISGSRSAMATNSDIPTVMNFIPLRGGVTTTSRSSLYLTFQSTFYFTLGVARFDCLTFIDFFLAARESKAELNMPTTII